MTDNSAYTFKILIVGNSGVGKTSIWKQYAHNSFENNIEPTVGIDFIPMTLNIDDKIVKLQIWDTAGQEQYRSLGRAYYRNALGAILVFAYNDQQSFENLDSWLDDIKQFAHPHARIIMVGNKIDLSDSRCISKSEATDFAKVHNLEIYDTSAKLNQGVAELFNSIARSILQGFLSGEIKVSKPQIQTQEIASEAKLEEEKKCC